MFTPNLKCKVRRRVGTDLYGKPVFGPLRTISCGIVRIEEISKTSSVRTDSSASRGNAMEEIVLSRILVPANVKLDHGDEVIVAGFTLAVMSVFPRYSVVGKLDHWQLDMRIQSDHVTPMQLAP